MKKIFCLVLTLLLMFVMTSCVPGKTSSDNEKVVSKVTETTETKETSKISEVSKETETSQTSKTSGTTNSSSKASASSKEEKSESKTSSVASETETSKLVDEDLGNVLTGTVDITVPVEFLELGGEPFNYELTEENKQKGFTSIKKNDDGSATYTMKKDDYDKFISDLKEETKNSIDTLNSDRSFASVQSITYNDDFSEIIINADRTAFESGFDSICIMSCGLTSCLYQMYDIDAKQECVVKVKDTTTGEIFKTETYPQ